MLRLRLFAAAAVGALSLSLASPAHAAVMIDNFDATNFPGDDQEQVGIGFDIRIDSPVAGVIGGVRESQLTVSLDGAGTPRASMEVFPLPDSNLEYTSNSVGNGALALIYDGSVLPGGDLNADFSMDTDLQ